MAKAKLPFKTPLLPLSWVNVRGQGKLKMDKDPASEDPDDYNYTATVTMDKDTADTLNAKLKDFWMKNKPKGVGKQKYDLIKEEFIKKLDADGNVMKDEDDEPIKEPTGKYIMQAKTAVQWPDGKPNVIKLLGSNGKELPAGHELENGCGEGTIGIIHGAIGINGYSGNEGLLFFLNGVQIKDSTFTPYVGSDIDAEEIEDDVEDTEVEDTEESKVEV